MLFSRRCRQHGFWQMIAMLPAPFRPGSNVQSIPDAAKAERVFRAGLRFFLRIKKIAILWRRDLLLFKLLHMENLIERAGIILHRQHAGNKTRMHIGEVLFYGRVHHTFAIADQQSIAHIILVF